MQAAVLWQAAIASYAKNGSFEMPFIYINATFLPRQTRDKHRVSTQKRLPFSQVLQLSPARADCRRPPCLDRPGREARHRYLLPHRCVRKTASFLSFPYVCPEPVLAKCSFLYINGSKMPFFAGDQNLIQAIHSARRVAPGAVPVRKNASFAMPFYAKHASFCKDRIGTNVGKALKK
jgi:hypothetical protein